MSDTTTITIGSTTTQLVPPRSPTVRLELLQALPPDGGTVSLRLAGAAVGLCWPAGPGRPAARYGGDVAAYGLAVADDLLSRGLSVVDFLTAGAACLEAIGRTSLPTIGAAKEASRPFGEHKAVEASTT